MARESRRPRRGGRARRLRRRGTLGVQLDRPGKVRHRVRAAARRNGRAQSRRRPDDVGGIPGQARKGARGRGAELAGRELGGKPRRPAEHRRGADARDDRAQSAGRAAAVDGAARTAGTALQRRVQGAVPSAVRRDVAAERRQQIHAGRGARTTPPRNHRRHRRTRGGNTAATRRDARVARECRRARRGTGAEDQRVPPEGREGGPAERPGAVRRVVREAARRDGRAQGRRTADVELGVRAAVRDRRGRCRPILPDGALGNATNAAACRERAGRAGAVP